MLDKKEPTSSIRTFLDTVYGVGSTEKTTFKDFTDDEIAALANNLRAGVPMATPVFDGANELEIKEMLRTCRFTRIRPNKIDRWKNR